MSLKMWVNVLTLALVVLMLFFAREDLVRAWHMLWQVNLWVLVLIIPVQFLSYYASGAVLFSFLKKSGGLEVSKIDQPIMALELNFVNHILPTGGVSGASYMTWRLNKLGISTGRAALAQVVRFGMVFLSFAALLLLAVVVITLDGGINRITILTTCMLIGMIAVGAVFLFFVIGSRARLERFSHRAEKFINGKVRRWIRSKKPELVEPGAIKQALEELHDDYLTLKKNPRVLATPFLWGLVFNLAEVGMFVVTFLALGTFVNPAPILLAVGLAGMVSAFLVTPGGAGGFELVMIFFLTSTGVSPTVATAGVVLARTILLLLTITTGYFFYHRALKKYGKPATQR